MNEAPSCCNTVINGDSIRLQLGYYVTVYFFLPLSLLSLPRDKEHIRPNIARSIDHVADPTNRDHPSLINRAR